MQNKQVKTSAGVSFTEVEFLQSASLFTMRQVVTGSVHRPVVLIAIFL